MIGSAHAAPDGERGFTVLEALVATAIVVLAGFCGLAACRSVAAVLSASSAARQSADGLAEQVLQLRTEAASAFAVFVPPVDFSGRPNAGRELDFYAQSDDGRPVFWRYVYDAAAQTLQRWDYDAAGTAGVRDAATGAVDAAASYPPVTHVTAFAASALNAGELGDPSRNVYHGLAGLFAHPPRAYALRFAAAVPAAAGGNGVVQVTFGDPATHGVIHLSAGVLPSGFTVAGAPVWHAVVYRVDQTHRFALGLAGKSHVFINARIDVSYDGWATRIPWCDFNLLGAPDGLDPHDPHADYKPGEPIEQAPNILAACRARHPQPPERGSAGFPPDAGLATGSGGLP